MGNYLTSNVRVPTLPFPTYSYTVCRRERKVRGVERKEKGREREENVNDSYISG